MAKSRKKPKVREDLNTLAARIIEEASRQVPKTPDPEEGKNPAALELGKLDGKMAGLARSAMLSRRERSEIARKVSLARWGREVKPEQGPRRNLLDAVVSLGGCLR